MNTKKFFHAGGPVSSKAPCYLVRASEQSVLDALFAPPAQRQYVSVLGSRQVGKTSLLFRIRTILERRKIPQAYVDLSPLQGLKSSDWYNQLSTRLISQFKDGHSQRDIKVHDAPSFISFLDSLEVVSGPKRWGAIMFDEVASVPSNITNDFFPSLRELYTSRLNPAARPATHFVFLFAGSFYPDALVTNKDNSPFNVSDEVEVIDFEHDEVDRLLEKGAEVLNLSFETEAVEEIWDAAGGHPFLTQMICQDLIRLSKKVIGPTDVKAVVDRIVNTGTHTHLRSIVGYLKDNPRYTQLLRDVIVSKKSISMHRVDNTSVERIGVLVRDQRGAARVRNRIYERYLYPYLTDSSWVEEITSSDLEGREDNMAFDVFISYSHKDRGLRDKLESHLSNLRHQNVIHAWYDGNISPGTEWHEQILAQLQTAQIILLLISSDFMNSEFCYSIEMKQAIDRHNANQVRVIPIILRPTDWEGAPFAKLKVLPTDGKAITTWPNPEEAFVDIAKGIRSAVQDLIQKGITPNPH